MLSTPFSAIFMGHYLKLKESFGIRVKPTQKDHVNIMNCFLRLLRTGGKSGIRVSFPFCTYN